jgi:hypothetical protein
MNPSLVALSFFEELDYLWNQNQDFWKKYLKRKEKTRMGVNPS